MKYSNNDEYDGYWKDNRFYASGVYKNGQTGNFEKKVGNHETKQITFKRNKKGF